MSKRILSLLMVILMVLSLVHLAAAVEMEHESAQAEQPVETVTEQDVQTEQTAETEVEAEVEIEAETEVETEAEGEEVLPAADFYVNGQPVYDAGLYRLNDVDYAPVRPFFEAALPGCEIKWENGQALISGVTAAGETLTVSARPGQPYVEANGRYFYVADGVQLANGATMIPLNLLADLFCGALSADEQGTVCVTLGETVVEQADYDAEQLDLFSRLIFAEAGNQSMLGKLAVGSVVLNRMNDPQFPGTLHDVIYQRNQFSVVNDGAIRKTPSAEAIIAAKLCMEGVTVTDALFFNVRGLRCWAATHRSYIATIGNHDFYA